MNNNDLNEIIFSATIHTEKRPGSIEVPLYPTIEWKDTTKEVRNDKTRIWWTKRALDGKKKKVTFRDYTKEEKESMRLDSIWQLEHMFDYILNNYGWEYAKAFYFHKDWYERFKNFNVTPNLKVPHCKYTYDRSHQCDLFCPFFNCKCTYEVKI